MVKRNYAPIIGLIICLIFWLLLFSCAPKQYHVMENYGYIKSINEERETLDIVVNRLDGKGQGIFTMKLETIDFPYVGKRIKIASY